MPRISQKRYRPGPSMRRDIRIPGQSVQFDVKPVKLTSGRLYPFTAIDEATRYRVLKIYDHNSIRSAIDFVDEVRKRLPVATIRTDNGPSSAPTSPGTSTTNHKHIPPGCPQANGKVERSHRTDEDEFYRWFTFRGPSDLRQLLRGWEREYNNRRPHLASPPRQNARRRSPRTADPKPTSAGPTCCAPFCLIITTTRDDAPIVTLVNRAVHGSAPGPILARSCAVTQSDGGNDGAPSHNCSPREDSCRSS